MPRPLKPSDFTSRNLYGLSLYNSYLDARTYWLVIRSAGRTSAIPLEQHVFNIVITDLKLAVKLSTEDGKNYYKQAKTK